MKTIVILMDSLNRHFLAAYGNDWVKTPNIDRLARMSVTFDNHWIGSAPCMPARRDMFTARLNFLERQWSGLEPYDLTLPRLLRQAGVFCHMETDHYHYFHVGGENYHTPFDTWRFHRGQESDVFVSTVAAPAKPTHLGKWNAQYARNTTAFHTDADFPSPKTFRGATEWLQQNAAADNYLLWVEAFSPHEPFDCPREFLDLYKDDWTGPLYNWSGYEHVEEHSPATEHLRRCYAATLTMTDKWLGKMLDEIERQGGLSDTLIIFTTDHGHMLGEHGCTGKNAWHAWAEMSRIPLMVHLPGSRFAGERRHQLTQNIDLMPTILKYHGIPCPSAVHGRSWKGILEHNAPSAREVALYGWFGQTVNITDGRHTYFRSPAREDNQPLYLHFLLPTTGSMHDMVDWSQYMKAAEVGRFLPYVDYPVLRSRLTPRGRYKEWEKTQLFDLQSDPHETSNLAGGELEARFERLLVEAMRHHDSPPSQYERLGLLHKEET